MASAPQFVLIVDDDPLIRRLLAKTVSGAGYEVLEAADGRRAVEQVREGRVDLVLTDIVMPDQEGVETITQLRREFPEVKVVAMSGAANGAYLKICQLLGASAVLRKPFSPHCLIETIRGVLNRGGKGTSRAGPR
jgi:CheY-like chemotaxis protein